MGFFTHRSCVHAQKLDMAKAREEAAAAAGKLAELEAQARHR
jgi:hypothetical protein